VTNQKLVEWAKKKLDEGMDEDRIREALEKSGKDPQILEKAKKQRNSIERNQASGRRKTGSQSETSGNSEQFVESLENNLPNPKPKNYVQRALNFFTSNLKILGVLLLVLMLISGGWALFSSGVITSIMDDGQEDNQTTETVSNPDPRSEYTGPTVFLNEGVAAPSRASISSDEQLIFVNNVTYSLEIRFESEEVEGFTLEPGETRRKSFSSLFYYTASPVNQEDKPVIRGSVISQ
jgi:hypothetical protein